MATMPGAGPSTGLPIAAVEQATGIARATLRIWERRYGFPQPQRDARDERSYPPPEVEKLRLMAVLMAQGFRPGRLAPLTHAQLTALAAPPASGLRMEAVAASGLTADGFLALLRGHDVAALVRHLGDEVRSLGLVGFITGRMPGLNLLVGRAWSCGELQMFEEHLYTECVQQVLRVALAAQPGSASGPRVLLATLPEEPHALGLLMAHGVLAAQGCNCTSLGVQLPVAQIAAAAVACCSDIVGLGFSGSLNPARALRGLEQLRRELPPRVAIWAGGNCPALQRRRVAGVRPIRDIAEVPAVLAEWRQAT